MGGSGRVRRSVFGEGGLDGHDRLINYFGNAFGTGGDAFGSETSGVVGELAGEGDGAVLDGDVDGGGFQERLGKHFGLDVGGDGVVGDGVVGGLVASSGEYQSEGEKRSQKSRAAHWASVVMRRGMKMKWLRRTGEESKRKRRKQYKSERV
jgi:hypothetical protein